MNRRDLLKSLAIAVPGAAYAQQMFHAAVLPTMVFQTTHTTGFAPSFTKTGATLYWKWPDGTYTSSNAPTKTLAAGTKRVEVQSRDGFQLVTVFNSPSMHFSGTLPSFAACTKLVYVYCYSNSFSGTLPSFATCTKLAYFSCYSNSFSGTLPPFAACTSLVTFYCHYNGFSGTLPSFAACTALVNFACLSNQFSDVVAGSFATQKSMSAANFSSNALPAAAVNQVLADFVVSLGISGRVACTVNLAGGTNAAPTGQGLTDKATLVAAGWTVTTT